MGGETLELRGSMVRDFPTTAAIAMAGYSESKAFLHVTLVAMLFCFGSFNELDNSYQNRHKYLENQFIEPLTESYTEEKAKILW